MKKSFYSVCLTFLSICITNQVYADLGVVSLKRCLEESALGKKETEDFENMKQQFTTSAAKVEEELTALYTKLQDEDYMEGLSSTAAEELRKKFEELSAEYNTMQSQYYQMLNQTNMKRIQVLVDAVRKASEIVRQREGLEAILNDEAVLAILPSADKTTDIIKVLDASFAN